MQRRSFKTEDRYIYYVKSLETIMKTEQESKRRDNAKLLSDNYKKTSKKLFTGNKMGMVTWRKSARWFVIQNC
jgi:hypothetical protein